MGTFAGHALPGSFFLIFGVWWTIQITRRYVACKAASVPFYSSVTFPCFCFCVGLPFEGIVKILLTSIGMIAEMFGATQPIWREHAVGRMGDLNGFFVGDLEHISMYLFFCLSGVVDVLLTRRNTVLPGGLDYAISFLAFIAELILFRFHGHGQAPLEMAVHKLLIYTIAASAVTIIIEYNSRHNILSAYARTFMVFLQGMWFWQVGFILYPPFPWLNHWDQQDHHNIMFATAIFTWHVVVVLILMTLIAVITHCVSNRHLIVRKSTAEYNFTISSARSSNLSQDFTFDSSSNEEETNID